MAICYNRPSKLTHSLRKLHETHRHFQQEGFPKMHRNPWPSFVVAFLCRIPGNKVSLPPSLPPSPFHCCGRKQGDAAVSSAGSHGQSQQGGEGGPGARLDKGELCARAKTSQTHRRCQTPRRRKACGAGAVCPGGKVSQALGTQALFFRKELLTAHYFWGKDPLWGEGAVAFHVVPLFWR